MEIGNIRKVSIDEEMQHSYLDYAMSVIVARALPDARDGLKPVQRRILYAMHDMGLRPDSEYKKSARIVGEVLGKYHPHGDMAVYEAMARLGQDFSMRYLLVDGQGNFGSVDGDPPAAMRYTEARLKAFTLELINQIDRNTVDFAPNFDDTLKEPVVLPAAVPNLLVNGAAGIAVGMATNIPPHNLGEVVDALIFMLEKWEKLDDVNVKDLMRFVKGPDFPTGGVILQENQENDLQTVYATGRGRVIVRGQVHIEEMGRGRNRLIVTELPYLTNKSSLIEKIAELVRTDGLEGISDLRDESDRHGMRIVIELGKGVDEEKVIRELYRRTQLQSNFGINLLALINGEPHLMTLKQALKVFLDHRLQVVERRSRFDLEKARQRAHILEGLRVALKNLDEIIALIRKSEDTEDARLKLMKRYRLSEIQAQAILDMPLKRLAALERKKIELEYQELMAQIKDLEALLASPHRMRQVVEKELAEVKDTYSDRRRTQIISLREGEKAASLLTRTDMLPAETVWVGITKDLLIGRTFRDELPRFRSSDAPAWLVKATTHQTLYLAASNGRASAIAIHSLPEVEHFADGTPIGKVSALREENRLATIFTSEHADPDEDGPYVVTISRLGMVKKSAMIDLPGPSGELFTLAKINDGDELAWAVKTDGGRDILLATRQGMGIRFSEEDVRPMGLVAAGVNGIKLAAGDQLAGAGLIDNKDDVLLVSGGGMGWRMAASEFPRQGRYGQGVAACKPVKGDAAAGLMVGPRTLTGIVHLVKSPARQIHMDAIPQAKRTRAGHELLDVHTGDSVQSVTAVEGAGESRKPHSEPVKAEQPDLFGMTESGGDPDWPAKTAARRTKGASAEKKSVATAKKASSRAVQTGKITGMKKIVPGRSKATAGTSKKTSAAARTKSSTAGKTSAPARAKTRNAAVKTKPAADSAKSGTRNTAKTPAGVSSKAKPASSRTGKPAASSSRASTKPKPAEKKGQTTTPKGAGQRVRVKKE